MTDLAPLSPKAARSVRLATRRLNIWEGSVRSGKTVASLLAWLAFVRHGPAGNLAMVGKTERTLRRNIIDPLVDMLGEQRARPHWARGEMTLLGRRVYLAGANDEAAVGKIQGLTLAGAYVDEASLVPEGFWSMLLTRLSIGGARLYATSNPDNPHHWLKRDYLDRADVWLDHDGREHRLDGPLNLARFSFRLRDNPTLPPEYVAALEAEFGTGLWRKRYVDGLWVLAEGAVYDGFDPDPAGPHVVDDLPRDASGRPLVDTWLVSVDYGTVNPFVALLVGVGDDRLYVAREWRWDSRARGRQMTDGDYSAALRAWLEGLASDLGPIVPAGIFVDPSAASFIAQLHRDGWARVRGADNAVLDGIRAVSALLGAGRLVIHRSCTGLIGEMAGYVWDEKAAKDRGVEQPLKVDDHGPDALRYGVVAARRWWRHWFTASRTAAALDAAA